MLLTMTRELLAAVAELRAWAAREGAAMDHLSDAEVLEGAMQAMTMMPGSTTQVVTERGLTRLAPVLARFSRGASDTKH